MNAKVVIVVGFLVAVGAIFFFQWKSRQANPGTETTEGGKSSKDAVEISFLYSTEKKEWIESATAAFAAQNPGISVKLVGKGSLEEIGRAHV